MTMQPDNPLAPGGDLRAGVLLHNGRYRVRSKLGQGGMGSVYLAEDTLLPGRLVAVKENADASAEAQSQFKREALLLARLRHPNLPQVTDYFVAADGRQHLVMDYVPGDNLTELMRKRQGALPATEALSIIEQVMQALAYMHTWRDPDSGRTRPIIHRDIKPANIKRTPEGRVVLVDFGIAKVDSNTMTGTAVSAKALTPGYAPLEQYGGGTDARSDIYSLGATLYALLTGKAPPSATDMAMAGSKQQAPLLANLKGAPPAIVKVVERAMQSLPKDRYQSVAEMHQALYNRPLSTSGTAQAPASTSAGARRWWPAFLLGVLALLAAAGVGWLLAGQSGVRSQEAAILPATAAPEPPITVAADLPLAVATPAAPTPAPISSATPTSTTRSTALSTATLVPTPTPLPTATTAVDATATAFAQEVLRRVAATQTAVADLASAATQTAQAPTITPTPTHTPTPTPLSPRCEVTSPSLNLRGGPGVVYEPPLATLSEGASLAAVGRNAEATWLAVEVIDSGTTGWVNAGAEFVQCNVDVEQLPVVAPPPTPTPLPTATPAPLLIVGAQTSSGNPVRVQDGATGSGLAPGQPVYTDRGYTYSGVPAALSGATYLATPNEEAETEEQNFQLFLTINRPATIYVAFSDGYAARPGWLQSFNDTGQDLTFVDQKGNTVVLSLYARTFPAGQVVLGGNTPAGSDRHSMYTVVIQETP